MRRFVLGWKQLGYEEGLKARIVNYADDFVILSVNKGQEAYEAMKQMMKKLGLEVNEDKTRLCQVPEETFEFLGYRFGRCYSTKTGRAYIGTRPSPKKVQGIMERISQKTGRATLKQDVPGRGFSWKRGRFSGALFRGNWRVGHGVI